MIPKAAIQMTFTFLRRGTFFRSLVDSHCLGRACSFSLKASATVGYENEATQFSSDGNYGATSVNNYDKSFHLSPLFSDRGAQVKDYKIELVDNETWRVSTGLADAWRGTDGTKSLRNEVTDEIKYETPIKEDPDFDDIEDMRIRGNLFYKLDRDSKEYEEYNFEFHRRKSSKNKVDRMESKKKGNQDLNSTSRTENSSKNREKRAEIVKKGSIIDSASGRERLVKVDRDYHLTASHNEIDGFSVGKKQRTPTFNQLTAPYHEPFCLDIYISKASVRACIVHRATSNVVVVAHSISKDMKFDLGSTRHVNITACAAVGEVLAQRALADDIHNVVYTPRKGDKLEGKLQIVLGSIINNGVDVKVKIKQRKFKKAGLKPAA